MSNTYVVTDARVVKENVGQYGLNVIKATFSRDGKSAEAEFNQKPSTPIPADGTELTGDLTQSEYGLKFKKEWTQGGGGNYGGGSNGQSDDRSESIQRQTALKVAGVLVSSYVAQGAIKPEEAPNYLRKFTEAGVEIVDGKATEKPEGKAQTVKSDDDIPF